MLINEVIEILAIVLSLIYVFLAAREKISCWIFAAISVIMFAYLCFQANLYLVSLLQIFYLAMAIYGFIQWGKTKKVQIKKYNYKIHLAIVSSGLILTYFTGSIFKHYTNAAFPYLDSFTTIFSLFATIMVVRKILDNWLYWIIIDLVSIYLYFNRGLEFTSLLFFIYTIIAIFGYFSWKKKFQHENNNYGT